MNAKKEKIFNVTEGSKLNIECDIKDSLGSSNEKVIWQKNGISFTALEASNFLNKSDKSELTFKAIQLSNSANYSCTLTNRAGSATQYIQINVGGR